MNGNGSNGAYQDGQHADYGSGEAKGAFHSQFDNIEHDLQTLRSRFDCVEKLKNDNWFDTTKKLAKMEKQFGVHERMLNQRIKEIKSNIFSHFSKDNLESVKKNMGKIEMINDRQKDLESLILNLEKNLNKSNTDREK